MSNQRLGVTGMFLGLLFRLFSLVVLAGFFLLSLTASLDLAMTDLSRRHPMSGEVDYTPESGVGMRSGSHQANTYHHDQK